MTGQSGTVQQQDTLNRYLLFFPHRKDITVDVHSFTGVETLSHPYRYTLRFTSLEQNLPMNAVLNQTAEFVLRAPNPKATWHGQSPWLPVRHINGVITSFSRIKSSADEAFYECVLEHELALLDRNYRSAVYMDASVPELVTKQMNDSGYFDGYNIDFDKLSHTYPRREMIIQWKETGPIPDSFKSGYLISSMTISGSRAEHYRAVLGGIPYLNGYSFRPALLARPVIAGSVPARVATIARDKTYAGVDAQGRYRVKFDFDLDERREGFESALVRLGRPYAGDTYGFHFPLLDKTEVAVMSEAVAQLEKALSLARTLQQSALTAGSDNVETDQQNTLKQTLNKLTGAGILTYADEGLAQITRRKHCGTPVCLKWKNTRLCRGSTKLSWRLTGWNWKRRLGKNRRVIVGWR
ncbi:hypothetical protein MUU48_15550 [Scandinavium sp. H11S7]|uniref:contractile injection system protein, VgrG/Pvc8 family n=1 Tax=Scandinavium hiltneri TaxID=2926519 RepID=UPI002166B77D|nr:contractile injection system protein, VgrG/Pvc8 family [Scandinavium hiltneri]MCS2158307.1 hypothetical protein [Scandinavium hiltneri]